MLWLASAPSAHPLSPGGLLPKSERVPFLLLTSDQASQETFGERERGRGERFEFLLPRIAVGWCGTRANGPVSDQEIASCVDPLLRLSDLATASVAGVVRRFEAKPGLDLSHKAAAFTRDQTELILGSSRSPASSSHSQPPFHQQHPAAPHNPYIFLYHLPFQQQITPPKPISSAAVATPATFPNQQSPGIVFHPPPPPLPSAAVVAAYHLQQQLHQVAQGVPTAVRPVTVSAAAQKERNKCYLTTIITGENLEDSFITVHHLSLKMRWSRGLNKVCGVSPELQFIVGEAAMSTTQIVKQLWAYIQDTGPESKKLKVVDVAATEVTKPDADECPLVISGALAKLFGSEEREMLQSEALSRVWDHINANQLEDSSNTSVICDSKLEELFRCESIPFSGISNMLANHLFRKS
ncbi:hypothetical protein C4D60_Mb07t22330 [Musa balbisiana]|uniref:DM2 domain-containing protein n=1 Tax=Musa balbisiana TaxID=52838 RepID=A0A4S8JH67_MUSBA|nr:hypothetical protein C4D60_Mb07t22330 [Musa balbisiana]